MILLVGVEGVFFSNQLVYPRTISLSKLHLSADGDLSRHSIVYDDGNNGLIVRVHKVTVKAFKQKVDHAR